MKKYVVDFQNKENELKVIVSNVYAECVEDAISIARHVLHYRHEWECIGIDRINEDD